MIDRILMNGTIYTLNDTAPRAEALAIVGERIVAVGSNADIKPLAGPHTVINDLGGMTVLPGLTDAHIHWEWTSRGLDQIDLSDTTKPEALARIAAAVAQARPGEWIVGRGWSQAPWPGGAFPTAADLDAIAPHHPVFLNARSGHAGWVNTAALRLARIDSGTADPFGGQIQRDSTGSATGILFESPAMRLVEGLIPSPTPSALAEQMARAQRLVWQVGLTGIHDFDDQSAFESLQLLLAEDRLGLRVLKQINRAFFEYARGFRVRFGFGSDWLRIGGLKLFADGALGALSAAMIAPYTNDPTNPDNRGIVVTDKEEMAELVTAASRAGLPSTIHAIGDRAVHDVLDVYTAVRQDEAARQVPRMNRRHRIEHVQLIHSADVNRLAELDLIASMQPIHATSDYLMADRYWGPAERVRYGYNPRRQIDAGARIAFGSDSPVESFDPRAGIHAAITRRRPDGSPGRDGWYPEARVTLDEAIRGYTLGPAWASGMEKRLGQLRPGFLADLIVLDQDWYQLDPAAYDSILTTAIPGTMVGGVWRQGQWT